MFQGLSWYWLLVSNIMFIMLSNELFIWLMMTHLVPSYDWGFSASFASGFSMNPSHLDMLQFVLKALSPSHHTSWAVSINVTIYELCYISHTSVEGNFAVKNVSKLDVFNTCLLSYQEGHKMSLTSSILTGDNSLCCEKWLWRKSTVHLTHMISIQ